MTNDIISCQIILQILIKLLNLVIIL